MQSSEWFLLYSFSEIFLAFLILCGNKMFCKNKRNIPHQCEKNRPSSEGGNICARIKWWTPCWWRLSDVCGEVKDSRIWSLRWVLGVWWPTSRRMNPKYLNLQWWRCGTSKSRVSNCNVISTWQDYVRNDFVSDSFRVCVIAGSRRDVVEICDFLGCYTAWSVKSLQTFRDNLTVPS